MVSWRLFLDDVIKHTFYWFLLDLRENQHKRVDYISIKLVSLFIWTAIDSSSLNRENCNSEIDWPFFRKNLYVIRCYYVFSHWIQSWNPLPFVFIIPALILQRLSICNAEYIGTLFDIGNNFILKRDAIFVLFFLNLDWWGKPPFNWEKLRHLLEIVKSCIIWYIMQHGLKIFIATILSFEFKIPNDLINKFRFQWTSLYYCSLSISFITFWKFSLCEKHIFTNRNSVLYRSPTDPRKTWYNALYVQYD